MPAALRDGFQSPLLQPGQRSQGDRFMPSPAPGQRPAAQAPQTPQIQQAPPPRPVARAEQPRSAAESVPANRNDHIQQHYDRLRTGREAETGRPLNRTEQAEVRRQAEQVADRERATAANKVREEMLARAKASTARIAGQTPEGLVRRAITENPNVTNEQILAMARLRPEQVASSPDAQRRTLEQIPNARSLPSHQFTVDMLHAVTGIDRETLSRNGPDLGITGSADRVWPGTQTPIVFHAPPNDRERLSTSLHDLTDTMRYAGVPGMNQAVWGAENQVRSAAISLNGVPPNFLDQSTLGEGDSTVRPRNGRR
ncbi:MAG TPA: hypothetical protein VIG99_01295 [Myxococcaceae bacterium]|jgi:hypothetical protein